MRGEEGILRDGGKGGYNRTHMIKQKLPGGIGQ